MRRRTVVALSLAAVLCCLWAAPALAATYGTVHGGWLRLRANPSYSAPVICSYRNGTVVTVLSQENGWARVLTADYRIGYMDARYLYIGSDPAPQPYITPQPQPQPYITPVPYTRTWTEVNRPAYVTSSNGPGVRLRSAPEVNNGNILGLYPVGRTVTEIRRSSDGWSYIRIDRKHGYMMTRYLTSSYYAPAPQPWVVTPAPTPASTYVPAPASDPWTIQSVKVLPNYPKVGDTVTVEVYPSAAQFTVVWYNDLNSLLGTSKSYTVRSTDVGRVIKVRIQGVGNSAGFVADGQTQQVADAATVPEMTMEWVSP